MRRLAFALVAFLPACILVGPSVALDAEPKFTPEQLAFYEKDVKPILKANCLKCHGNDPKKIRGGLDLSHRAALVKGGDTGPGFDAKSVDESQIIKAVRYKNEEAGYNMPPAGKLPAAQIATLEKWVKLGAPYTGGASGDATQEEVKPKGADKKYWAFQPVERPAVPSVRDAGWVKTPIDAFILAKIEEKQLKPVGPVSKAALIRRVTYDLTGLPPTPEQVTAFVSDTSPKAYENLVDGLLASKHYGEKWGRHWLDVVRYAETNGYERDGPKPHVWRYRDYVIRSFNDDKPYDRFLTEQLAGDELAAREKSDNPDAVIAAGFYRLGVWDDEPADRPLALYDGYDDYVSTVGQGMLGMTLNCARCHDHKGDFFPQDDYYRLLAFFRDVKPYDGNRDAGPSHIVADVSPAAKRHLYEAELKLRQKDIDALKAEMKPIEDAAIRKMEPKDQLAVQDGRRDEIIKKVPVMLHPDDRKVYNGLKKRIEELRARPMPNRDLALTVANVDRNPPVTHTLIRGNPGAQGKAVQPGFPEVFGVPDPKLDDGRRTALAQWVTSPANPMTARVLVNRLWLHHFGKAIVPTPNDFGKFGEKPTHPELLDWLASEFVSGGWTIKRMQKLILMSNTYQLASTPDAAGAKADPANTLRRFFDMRRLNAEEVRDSFLLAVGKLKLDQFGPSVYPKIPAAVLAGQSRPGEGWPHDPNNADAANRRSIYVHVKRNLQVPILAVHDQADADTTCPVRYTTTVPTQALGLLNGEFSNEHAANFARRLEKELPNDPKAQVIRAVQLTTGRTPSDAEIAKDVAFIETMRTEHKLDATTALTRYALLILNSNEFLYLD